jgi:3-hydroxybutyrate dehydrogenase
MGRLEGQVAAITGGTRRVGRAIAEAYVREGATVVAGDVGEQSAVEGLIDRAMQECGRLDVVVLNGGGSNGSEPVATMPNDDWQRALDLNLNHVFWGIRRALHHMLPRRRGRIVVTSTVEGKLPRPGASAYVAANHGINGLSSQSLAR